MRDKNFVWLMAGSIVSMLGDQFTLVALPWLVLRMTGDTLVLGTVLGLMSLPRALFILIGGAVVDRYSPKKVLMVTKYINAALLAALAVLVLYERPVAVGGVCAGLCHRSGYGIQHSIGYIHAAARDATQPVACGQRRDDGATPVVHVPGASAGRAVDRAVW